MSSYLKVTVLFPDTRVPTMREKIRDGSVNRVKQSAIAVCANIPNLEFIEHEGYGPDLDSALLVAEQIAAATAETIETAGNHLFVVITDLKATYPARVERSIDNLGKAGHFVGIVPVATDYNINWLTHLSQEIPVAAASVSVMNVKDLHNPKAALEKVWPWAQRVTA